MTKFILDYLWVPNTVNYLNYKLSILQYLEHKNIKVRRCSNKMSVIYILCYFAFDIRSQTLKRPPKCN